MAIIKVLKVQKYQGCPIYLRQLDSRFEYLVIYNKQLFSQYFDIRANLFRKIFCKEDYSPKQIQDIVKMLIRGAHITIDELKSNKKRKRSGG